MTIRGARKIQPGGMDSRPEHAEKTRPVDASLVSCVLTKLGCTHARQRDDGLRLGGKTHPTPSGAQIPCRTGTARAVAWFCHCRLRMGKWTNLSDRAHWNASRPGMRGRQLTYEEALHGFYRFAPSPASPWISSWLGRATRQPRRRCSTLQAFQVVLDSEQAVDGNQCHALPKPSVEVPVAPIKVAA